MRNKCEANHVLYRDGVYYYVRRVPHDCQLIVKIIQYQPNQQQTKQPEHKKVSFTVIDYAQTVS